MLVGDIKKSLYCPNGCFYVTTRENRNENLIKVDVNDNRVDNFEPTQVYYLYYDKTQKFVLGFPSEIYQEIVNILNKED